MILIQEVFIWGGGGSSCVYGSGADALDGHSAIYSKGLILFQHDIDVFMEAKTVLIFV